MKNSRPQGISTSTASQTYVFIRKGIIGLRLQGLAVLCLGWTVGCGQAVGNGPGHVMNPSKGRAQPQFDKKLQITCPLLFASAVKQSTGMDLQ